MSHLRSDDALVQGWGSIARVECPVPEKPQPASPRRPSLGARTIAPPVRLLFVGAVIGWVFLWAMPELPCDRIHPYDDALFASNGAFFLTMFSDLEGFVRAPLSWMYEYFHQYPALAVRRHPPVFGIVEALVYSLTGVCVLGAKLTVLLFAVGLALGIYFLCLRFWNDDAIALLVSLLFLTTPEILRLSRGIWLDIPALAFAVWAFYHYAGWLESRFQSGRSMYLMVLFIALSLYTYQLTVYLFTGIFIHALFVGRGSVWTHKQSWVAVSLLLAALAPLALFSLLMARDNLTCALGGTVPEFATFAPVQDKLALAYWSYYTQTLFRGVPLQAAGILLWLAARSWKRLSTGESLCLVCFLIGYLGFSLIPSKVSRYTLYLVLPACPLTVLACREMVLYFLRERRLASQAALVGICLVAGGVQAWAIYRPGVYVAGMDKPVHAILGSPSSWRILYSGPMDASFVFYTRQADAQRQARVYRAGVHLAEPAQLASFLAQEEIHYVVFEGEDITPATRLNRQFRTALQALVEGSPEFVSLGASEVLFGAPGQEASIPIHVYARNGQAFAGVREP